MSYNFFITKTLIAINCSETSFVMCLISCPLCPLVYDLINFPLLGSGSLVHGTCFSLDLAPVANRAL